MWKYQAIAIASLAFALVPAEGAVSSPLQQLHQESSLQQGTITTGWRRNIQKKGAKQSRKRSRSKSKSRSRSRSRSRSKSVEEDSDWSGEDLVVLTDDSSSSGTANWDDASSSFDADPFVSGCLNDFVCPSNSVRKPNRQCYDTFDDCECVHGFVKSGFHCVPVHVFQPEPFVGTFHFRAFADSFQEVPPINEPHALGYVSAQLHMRKDAPSTLSWIVHFDGLSSEVTLIHFHGPAPKGVNAGIQVVFPQPSRGFSSPNKGVAEVSAKQAADIINGLWYINIHTTKNPAGEIRGQLFLTV